MNDDVIRTVAMAIAVTACVTDLRTRRIPNRLTVGAAVGALLFELLTGGLEGAWHAVSGWLVGLIVFFPLFALGGMGAGDVKLLAALGAWLGPANALWLAIYSSLAGGALAVAVAMAHGYLHTAWINVGAMLAYWRTVGPRPVPNVTLETATAPRLAYAVPMLAGTVVTLWLR